jgi:hypothetical protein
MKVLLVHPGHGHSTHDVYEGMHAGLEACGAEVVPFHWDHVLQTLTGLVIGASAGGMLKPDDTEKLHQWASWLACADVIAQLIDEEAEAVIVVNGLLFPPSRAALLKRIGIPVACYGTESPYFDRTEREIAPYYTHWFTNERTSVEKFADLVPTFYLPHAYNPKVHRPLPYDPAHACDLVFVGGGYPERKATLDAVNWAGIDRRIFGTLWGLDMAAEHGARDFDRGSRWTAGAIPNAETSAWHRSAKVALNMNRRMTYIETGGPLPDGAAESLGPRPYEIPAVGGFLLSDDERPELFDVYGESAATFKAWDGASLERELRYWLAHDDARERQQRAQAEAVRPHHWGARAQFVLETITS